MIEVELGDITTCPTDAIVNAANSELTGGGGVNGAIHRAAGPELLVACEQIGYCAPGDAVLTPAYALPSRYIIHTVGPVWEGGVNKEPETLAACYRNSLQVAVDNHIHSIAFPAISCGAYGYPIDQAAIVAIHSIGNFLVGSDHEIDIKIICFDEDILKAYKRFTGMLRDVG